MKRIVPVWAVALVALPILAGQPTPTPAAKQPQGAQSKESQPTVTPTDSREALTMTPTPASAAGIGNLRLDQADFRNWSYVERLAHLIGLNWFKPTQTPTTNPVIHFEIQRDGTITDVRMVDSSGLPYVDRAAMRAVIASSPVPPLPAEYRGSHLGIQVIFD